MCVVSFILDFERFSVLLKNYRELLDKKDRENDTVCRNIGLQSKTLQVHVSQPIHLLNNSAKLCLIKNTSCHQNDSTQISGWLIEAALVATPLYTALKIAAISICLLLTG